MWPLGSEPVTEPRRCGPWPDRSANEAHTVLPPSAGLETPHSVLKRATTRIPRPPGSPCLGTRTNGPVGSSSCTLNRTQGVISSRVTTIGVLACMAALLTSSLATSRTSSTRYASSCLTR